MNDLVLYKSDQFQGVECDFLRNENNEVFMTSEQLGMVLGYINPARSISNLINRGGNEYVKDSKFSAFTKMMTPSGAQETRVFNEDGIYEVAFLAKTQKAKEFRSWVREILKGLRKGELEVLQKKLIEQEEKVDGYNRLISATNCFTMLQVSKYLKLSGRNKLFKLLRNEKILMDKKERHNIPYQQYLDAKYFVVVVKPMIIKGVIVDTPVTLVTPKGLDFLYKRLKKKGLFQIESQAN